MNKIHKIAAAVVFSGAVISAPATAQKTEQQADWTKRVTVSEMGGHVLGNPLAKNKVTEYISYTCGHCANFEVQSFIPLKTDYVAKGHVNTEVRNYVRDPVDFTAALLARCGGRTKFFGNHHAFMAAQGVWLKKIQTSSPETQKSWYEGDFDARLRKIATSAGFYPMMAKRGFTATQSNACLADKDAQAKLTGMTKYAVETLKISGTPSFTLNGKVIDGAHNWTKLQQTLASLTR